MQSNTKTRLLLEYEQAKADLIVLLQFQSVIFDAESKYNFMRIKYDMNYLNMSQTDYFFPQTFVL